jgi:Tol biopolymer transport system component
MMRGMGRSWVIPASLALIGACKAELGDGPADAGVRADGQMNSTVVDAGTDGTTALGPWSTPAKVPGASSILDEDDPDLSSNELELYFKRVDSTSTNLYVMTRASTTSAWGAPTALGVLNTSGNDEESPRLSPDDLKLYFGRGGDIYVSSRTAVGQPWGAPSPVGVLNTGANEKWAFVCSDGYTIVSRATATNGQDLFEGTITTGANTPIPTVNSVGAEQGTFISRDCLTLLFQSNRTNNQFDIYVSTRAAAGASWGTATLLVDFNTPTKNEEDPWVSASEKTFVFASNSSGSKDIYTSTR